MAARSGNGDMGINGGALLVVSVDALCIRLTSAGNSKARMRCYLRTEKVKSPLNKPE